MTSAPSPSIYNQSILGDDDFVANFVARHDTLDALIRRLRAVGLDDTGQHHVLIGARGMGKSSLLRRVAIAITRDPELSARYVPLTFREEQYNVSTLGDFWRNCGEALAEWAETQGLDDLAARLDAALSSESWRGNEGPADQFATEMTRLERRAVLLIDNIDLILDALSEEDQWILRRYLQARRGPIALGAATETLAQTADHDNAFYEFFQALHLSPLSVRETEMCMRALAARRGEAGAHVLHVLDRQPERLKTLHTLSGGNPRILTLTYRLLESEESEAAMADLELLLDQVTPYYKSRIEEYRTAQQRKVIDAIALHWDPITLNALSEATDIVTTTLSPLLNKLRRDGLIEMVETSGSYSAHQLTERFLNIWYLMRHGTRRTKQKMRWLVAFLTSFYSSSDLARIARRADGQGDHWHKDYALAFNEAWADKNRDGALATEAILAPETGYPVREIDDDQVALLRKDALRFWREGEHAQCLSKADALLQSIEHHQSPKHARDIAIALRLKGSALQKLGATEDALAVYDTAIERFGSSPSRAARHQVGIILSRKAYILNSDGWAGEAIDIYDDVVRRFGQDDHRQARDLSARALLNGAILRAATGDAPGAIKGYDEVVARFAGDEDAGVRAQVDKALFNKAALLERLGDSTAAIDAYERAAALASDRDDEARALVNKGVLLGKLNDEKAALATFDAVLDLLGEDDPPELRRQAAMALINKAVTLRRLHNEGGEMDALWQVERQFGADEDIGVRHQVARAMVGRSLIAWMDDKFDLAIATCDEVVARFGGAEDERLREQVARALVNKGLALLDRDDLGAARSVFDDLIARFADSSVPALQVQLAIAMTSKAITMAEAGDEPAAMQAFDVLVSRFGTSPDLGLRIQVATALLNKAVALAQLGNLQAAIAATRDLDARLGDPDEPELRRLAATSRRHRASVQIQAGDMAAAIASYNQVLDFLSQDINPTLLEFKAEVQTSLGNIALDVEGDEMRAQALYEAASEISPILALSNLAWLHLLADRPGEATTLRASLDTMPDHGLALLDAGLALARDNFGLATDHLAKALGGELDQGQMEFTDDLDRLLRLADQKGHGEALLKWLETSGFADRLAPIHAAFRAYVRGERTLLDVNLEVRPPAQEIYARLDAARRGRASSTEKAKSKPRRGRPSKSSR